MPKVNYSITDAFKELDVLTEAESFNVNDETQRKALDSFLQGDVDDEHVEMIVDMDAESEEELKDSYVGNVIIECPTCKTKVYKLPEEIEHEEEQENTDSEEELVNITMECPHCGNTGGYRIIGKVAPYVEEKEEEEKIENPTPEPQPDAKPKEDEETPEDDGETEILEGKQANSKKGKKLNEDYLIDPDNEPLWKASIEFEQEMLDKYLAPKWEKEGYTNFDISASTQAGEGTLDIYAEKDGIDYCLSIDYSKFEEMEYERLIPEDVDDDQEDEDGEPLVTKYSYTDAGVKAVANYVYKHGKFKALGIDEKLNQKNKKLKTNSKTPDKKDSKEKLRESKYDNIDLSDYTCRKTGRGIEVCIPNFEQTDPSDWGMDDEFENVFGIIDELVENNYFKYEDLVKVVEYDDGDSTSFIITEKNGDTNRYDYIGGRLYYAKDEITESINDEGKVVIEEWWGQAEEDPKEFARKFNLTVKQVAKRRDEIRYQFVGTKEDVAKAKDAGYFSGIGQDPESVEYTADSIENLIENLDEKSFDILAKKYVNEVYQNVDTYTSTKAGIDSKTKTIVVEGLLKFKSGKSTPTKFIFEARHLTKNKVKLTGVNETFSKSKNAFALKGKVNDKTLMFESLAYNYTAKTSKESKNVQGKVNIKEKF